MSCYGLNIDREKHPIHSDDDSVWISFILRKKILFHLQLNCYKLRNSNKNRAMK